MRRPAHRFLLGRTAPRALPVAASRPRRRALRASGYALLSWLGLAAHAHHAGAKPPPPVKSQRLIMSLDVPTDHAPAYLCIVSTNRSCPKEQMDNNGKLIRETGCVTRELSDLQSIGSLRTPLPAGDVPIDPPADKYASRWYRYYREQVAIDGDLWEALQNLAGRKTQPLCGDIHAGCMPKVRLAGFARSGTIVCGRDLLPRNHYVAIVALSYHGGEFGSGVEKIELRGTSATILLRDELPAANYAFVQVLGGDYVFSSVAAIGTNERITVPLQPRCTMFGVEVPAHSSHALLSSASIELDNWGVVGAGDQRRDPIATLTDAPTASTDTASSEATPPVASCTPRVQQTTLPINVPYIEDDGTKRLEVRETATRLALSPSQLRAVGLEFLGLAVPETHDTILEASWNGPLPRDPVVLGYRRFEFMWRRHCLTGEWGPDEKAPADHSWNASCPRATLNDLLPCELVDQSDRSICEYACAIDKSAPALHLPASVRFERFRMLDGAQQLLYSWRDTLAFSRQELSSFVVQADQKIAVDLDKPEAWRSHTGNEIERIDVAVDSSDRPQAIPIGGVMPPPWTVIAAPTATCRSQFTVDIVGARQFMRRDLSLDRHGNLALASPAEYGALLHVAFTAGAGILLPNDPGAGFRGEPLVTVGAGIERYIEGSWLGHTLSGSLEGSIVYEPTFTAYGGVPGPSSMQVRPINVPYHRGMIELAATVWFRNRYWAAGVLGGPGIGGPIWDHGIVEQVGALHRFWYAGLLGRYNPFSLSRHAALELDVGIRWGETHEYFGVDATGEADPGRFHGDSRLVEHRVRQLYASLRWRIAFR